MTEQVYAEDVNYWQTSQSSGDTWLARIDKQIALAGGEVLRQGYIQESAKAAYLTEFSLDGELFRIVWPVLHSKKNNLKAARIQAATAMYHEIKAACVKARFLGARTAFLAFLVLPDGRVASEVSSVELLEHMPLAYLMAPPMGV